jgi:predicted nucleic acid-binding protein
MGPVVLDTSILLGVLDPQDALHQVAKSAVREHRRAGRTFAIPTSVLAEALAGAYRQDESVARRVESAIDILVTTVHPLDRDVSRAAATLRASVPALRLPDAIVLATARVLDATAVLTGDKRWVGVDRRVELLTPS